MGKIRIKNSEEKIEKNKKTLTSIMKEKKLEKFLFTVYWNICCEALGYFKKWTRKEIINVLSSKFKQDFEYTNLYR